MHLVLTQFKPLESRAFQEMLIILGYGMRSNYVQYGVYYALLARVTHFASLSTEIARVRIWMCTDQGRKVIVGVVNTWGTVFCLKMM